MELYFPTKENKYLTDKSKNTLLPLAILTGYKYICKKIINQEKNVK